MSEADAAAESRTPVVILGASNLVLAWRSVLRTLLAVVPGPMDLHVAIGMGRSYVQTSRYWFRRLPSISDCGLWSDLSGTRQPGRVLITDVGNDLMYGQQPPLIADRVLRCAEMLKERLPSAQFCIGGLPLCTVNQVGRLQYLTARTLLFPRCFLSLAEVRQRAGDLDQRVREIATRLGAEFVEPQAEWYEADPIHVARPYRETVFGRMLGGSVAQQIRVARPRAPDGSPDIPYRVPPAAQRVVLGVRRANSQPAFESLRLRVFSW